VQLLQLRTRVEAAAVKAMVGRRARDDAYGMLLTSGDATVFKPNGQRLLTVLRGVISEAAAGEAYPFLHSLKKHTTANRGAYSGEKREFKVKKNGEVSNTSQTPPIRSCVIGFFDRYPRYPFCGVSPIVVKDPTGWTSTHTMVREVGQAFERHVPDRYARQLAECQKTHPAYVVEGTPFTTMTVNNTVAGGYHTDAGDLKEGLGVMSVLRRGNYRGCHLVIPAYRVAVDLQDRDIILFDVHEIHGNTPFVDAAGEPTDAEGHERISIVYYYRQKMVECLSPLEELERAKKLRGDLVVPEPDETTMNESAIT
jgi:hypothetical protein